MTLAELVTQPKRIQRQRTKGWRMPAGAVYVGRPSRWGNPYRIETCRVASRHGRILVIEGGVETPEQAVREYRDWVDSMIEWVDPSFVSPLRGHDLACWCPFDQPCHVDVLLELANR